MNTLMMAIRSDASRLMRVRHNRNMHVNLENIREAVNMLDASFEASGQLYKHLQRSGINQADLKKYIKEVFNMNERPDKKTGEVKLATRTDNILNEIVAIHDRQLYGEAENRLLVQELLDTKTERESKLLDDVLAMTEGTVNTAVAGSKSNLWLAYNGVTEYLNYQRGRSDDTRLSSLWFGDSAKISQRALDLALEMSGVDAEKLIPA